MSEAWSPEEAEAAVVDYFVKLGKELCGEPLNKAEHNLELQQMLVLGRWPGR